MKTKCILVIGNFSIPDGNASGKRVWANALLLNSIGYKVICVGKNCDNNDKNKDIIIYTISTNHRVKYYKEVVKVRKIIEHVQKSEKIEFVYLYGSLFTQIENIYYINWAKKNNVKILYDHVDWFEFNAHHIRRSMVREINYLILRLVVWPQCDGIICISKYLDEYHRKHGRKTLVLPPLSIINSTDLVSSKSSGFISLVYSGTTADKSVPPRLWKDRLDIMFESLSRVLSNNCRDFQVNIFGMTESRYLEMCPGNYREKAKKIIEKLGNHVIFHGFVENSIVEKWIKTSDFSVLIRDTKRSTMAGFPTKVSESLSCGIPVICTYSSDLKDYIKDGKNGFICGLENVDAMLLSVLNLSDEQIDIMKENCVKNNDFYYLKYEETVKNFLEGLGELNEFL